VWALVIYLDVTHLKVNREYIEYISKLASEIRASTELVLRCVGRPFNELSEAERYAVRYNLIVIVEATPS
jgi:uncharacterized protein YutE (UPF0331/DUF86 family)